MASIYHLGWPGMELLPCIIVDQSSREMYHSGKPLPAKKMGVNTSENRYVEFARVLSLFPIDKQQTAMNTFMEISSEFCVRKFFMDNNQKAYISVDTLLIYVMVYPKCRAFIKAREQTVNYLSQWLDYPCLECGFIKRSGCLCTDDNPCDGEKTESIGYCTETIDRQIQTDPGGLPLLESQPSVTSQSNAVAPTVQQPPLPPVVPTFLPPGSAGTGTAVVTLTPSNTTPVVTPSPRVVNVITSSSGASVPMTIVTGETQQSRAVVLPNGNPSTSRATDQDSADQIIKQAVSAVSRSLLRVPPVQAVVAPMPPIRPKTRDVGIQTRANFDFTPRYRGKKRAYDDAGASEAAEKAAETEKSAASSSSQTPGETFPVKVGDQGGSTGGTPPQGAGLPALSVASLPTSHSQPIKVSLWKLLDSDSSDDEDRQKKEEKKSEESNKDNVANTQQVEAQPSTSQQKASVAGDEGADTSKRDLSTAESEIATNVSEADRDRVSGSDSPDKSGVKKTGEVSTSDSLVQSEQDNVQDTSVANSKASSTENNERKNDKFKEASLSSASENVVSYLLEEKEECRKESAESVTMETNQQEVASMETVGTGAGEEGADVMKSNTNSELNPLEKTETRDVEKKESDKKEDVEMDVDGDEKPLTIDMTEAENDQKNREKEEKKDEKEERAEGKDTENKEESSKLKKEVKKDDQGQRKKWYHKFEYVPTEEKLYRCTFKRCGQCFDSRRAAEVHNRVHGLFGQEDPINLTCYQCEYKAPMSRWFDMVRHLKDGHNVVVTEDPLGCHFCGKLLESEEKLLRHIDFHYMGRYKCVYCGALGFTWKQMENHVDTLCKLKGKREKHLGCPYCPLVFHIRNMRNAHMMAHTDQGLRCVFCKDKNVWESWTELRKHYQQKHGEKIRSALNPYRKSALQVKIQKNPECHVCAHECKTHEDYVYHMRKKHDFIPYVLNECQVCDKMFKSVKMFDWHMKHTHGNEVKCPKCDFTARNDLQLRAHDQSQHQAKEYECVECGKEFQFYHQLRMHMAHHALHTIYHCNECGAEFKRQKELRSHVKKEHPKEEEKPMQKCPDCDYESFTRRTLELHIKRYHPKLAEEIEESETRATPAIPEHSYFNTKASPPEAEAPRFKPPKPLHEVPPPPRPKTSSSGGSKKKKKGKKKWSYQKPRVPYQAELDENGDPITPAMSEKRRLKLEMREKVEKLKSLVKESCVRTRTYEENKELKLIKKRKAEALEGAAANTTTVETADGPEPKRQRVSKYGRSISVRTYGEDDIYMPKARGFSEKKSQRERPRAGDGIAPPESWQDEANTHYPYTDHCYFAVEAADNMAHSQEYMDMLSRNSSAPNYPSNYSNLRRSSQDDDAGDYHTDQIRIRRIGPPGSASRGRVETFYPRGRPTKQQQQLYQRGLSPRRSHRPGFVPLNPDSKMTHEIIKIQKPLPSSTEPDDMRLDDIDNELIKEVARDPLLQGIIDSMDQQQAHNITQESPNRAIEQQSRHAMPPSSLNLGHSGVTVIPPITPPSTPQKATSAAQPSINPGAGLTPTKQSVIDLLLSKIELNEEQLNRLIEEQTGGQGDLTSEGNVNSSVGDLIGQPGLAHPGMSGTDVIHQHGSEVLSLEQLSSGNVASITRINTEYSSARPIEEKHQDSTKSDNQVTGSENQPIETEHPAVDEEIPAVGTSESVLESETIGIEDQDVTEMNDNNSTQVGRFSQAGQYVSNDAVGRLEPQNSDVDGQNGPGLAGDQGVAMLEASEQVAMRGESEGIATSGSSEGMAMLEACEEVAVAEGNVIPQHFADVPVENEEVRVHTGSDTDSNPDPESEMMQHGVVPPSPVQEQGQDGDERAGDQPYGNLATLAQAVESARSIQEAENSATPRSQPVPGDGEEDAIGYLQSADATQSAVASIPTDEPAIQVRTVTPPVQQSDIVINQSQVVSQTVMDQSQVAQSRVAVSQPQIDVSQYRAITMSDGKGGTVRKIVRLVQKDSTPVATQGSTQKGTSATQGAPSGVFGQQIAVSGTSQVITQPGVSAPTQPTTIVRRVVTGLGQPQQQVVRRVVQIVSSQPSTQTAVQRAVPAAASSRVITVPAPPNQQQQVIRVAANQSRSNPVAVGGYPVGRGRPLRAAAPAILRRPGSGVAQIRVGTPQVRTVVSGTPTASSNVIRIAAASNQSPVNTVTLVTRQGHNGTQQ